MTSGSRHYRNLKLGFTGQEINGLPGTVASREASLLDSFRPESKELCLSMSCDRRSAHAKAAGPHPRLQHRLPFCE